MKRFSMMAGLLGLGACAMLMAAAPPAAQQEEEGPTTRTANKTARSEAGRLDEKTAGPNIRASKLIGMNIKNPQAKDLGSINDLVIDGNNGRIRYAAVSYGGFLGAGDKLFAVPWEALQVKPDPEDGDKLVLILDVTKQQLEGAQGFDQEHWPDFADRKFTDAIDKQYGVERRGVNVEAGPGGVNIDINRKPNNPDR